MQPQWCKPWKDETRNKTQNADEYFNNNKINQLKNHCACHLLQSYPLKSSTENVWDGGIMFFIPSSLLILVGFWVEEMEIADPKIVYNN